MAEPRLPTLGSLDSYEVTAVTQEDNALWRADVKAVLLLQQAPGPDRSHLPAIVVAPFTSDADEYTLGETTLSAAEVRRQLHANLIDAFAQSGRFRVLDRANLGLREAEQALLRDGAGEPRELLRLGKTKGADLLLVGHIEAFDIGDDERTFYGARFQGYEPYVRLRYRLIDAAGGEVRVEARTLYGAPIAGFALDECLPLGEDRTDHEIQWRSGRKLAELNEPVRLHFSLRQSRLYSFQIAG